MPHHTGPPTSAPAPRRHRTTKIGAALGVGLVFATGCAHPTPTPTTMIRPGMHVTGDRAGPSAKPSPSTGMPHASPSTPAAKPPAAPAVPAFHSDASPVTAADVPYTWRAGCPVVPARLRRLHLSYWGFDNRPHTGTMVVNAAVVGDVTKIFRTLYAARFPVRRMVPEDAFDGQDPKSMAADNTSGFNCRYAVAPGAPSWSVHAYGEAIDINTVENPYVEGGAVMPAAGKAYLGRSPYRAGMAVPGGVLVRAFASAGWKWGGRWTSTPDYQHFSKSGG